MLQSSAWPRRPIAEAAERSPCTIRSCEWFVSDDTKSEGRHDRTELTGDVVVAAVTAPAEKATLARSVPWVFVYEGTIAKGDALCAALDPGWVVSPGLLRRPGTMIFAHFITHFASVGRTLTAHSAMAKATDDLRRARSLGSAAFLCSDGSNLYAYAWGRPLCVSNVVGAIVVGSPEVMPASHATQHVPNDSLVALQREPQLGWALVQRDDVS